MENDGMTTRLGALHGARCREDGGTVMLSGGGNCFGLYDARTFELDFEAEVELKSGFMAAGLVFGAASCDIETLGQNWCAVHILPQENPTFRVFCEGDRTTAGGMDSGFMPLPLPHDGKPVRIRVCINESADLSVYIGRGGRPVYETHMNHYNGGYVGVMTYETEAVFSGIRYLGRAMPRLLSVSVDGAETEQPFDPARQVYTCVAEDDAECVTVRAESDFGRLFVCGMPLPADGISVPLARYGTDLTVTLSASADAPYSGAVCPQIVQLRVRRRTPPPLYGEPFRPVYHYTPAAGWNNDPNGLVYNAATGEYHLYLQYIPNVLYHNGQSHWGHAVSRDLVTWEEKPIVLYPDKIGTIWSGSCVIDRENTSGLFPEGVPPESRIVAVYTHSGYGPEPGEGGGQRVDIAFSTDGGMTMTKYAGNSVIFNYGDMYGIDFRDPKVLWMPETRLWLMVIAGGAAQLFTSPDLIHWTKNSNLYYPDGREIHSECPSLIPMPLDGDPRKVKWIYSGGGVFYVVGDLLYEDGRYIFRAETSAIPFHTGVQYASQNFSDTPDGRCILFSWMVELTQDTLLHYGKNWTGTMTVPELASLMTVNGRPMLYITPVPELNRLHGKTLASLRDVNAAAGGENPLSAIRAAVFDMTCVLDVSLADGFTLTWREKDGMGIRLDYDAASKTLTLDGQHAGIRPTGKYSAKLEPAPDGLLTLRILSDNGITDVYSTPGTPPLAVLAYSDPDADSLSLLPRGGTVRIISMDVFEMECIRKG